MAIDRTTLKRDVSVMQKDGRFYATVKLTTLSGNTGTGKASADNQSVATDLAAKIAIKALEAII